MKSNTQEEIIDLSELLCSVDSSAESPAPTSHTDNQPPAHSETGTTNTAEFSDQMPLSLLEGLRYLTDELRHLLRYLDLIEAGITKEGDLQKTVLIFRLIHEKSLSLIDRINALATLADTRHVTLWSALDTTGFALKHELRRVYEVETIGLSKPGSASYSRSDLIRAYGLLQNCFQQSAITLARVMNPTLDGEVLLDEYKVKREQSLVLHRELTLLLQKVSKVQKEAGMLQMLNVMNSLKRFQQETMHLLMYRDWGEFEGFVAEVVKTYDELGNLQPVLHRFASYLETLLKHVSMRAVLNDKTFMSY
jgi:hypothetical protein